MKILAIDTTVDEPIAILVDGDKLYTARGDHDKPNRTLLPMLEQILDDAKVLLSDVDYFSAVVGAGSFTGIRVGTATMNAISFVTKKPLISVTAFEIMLQDCEQGVALVDALHGAWYVGKKENGVTLCSYAESASDVPASSFVVKRDEVVDFEKKFADILRAKAERGDTVSVLTPLYLRASQAERLFPNGNTPKS